VDLEAKRSSAARPEGAIEGAAGRRRRRKLLEEVQPLLERAQKGDKEVLPKIRAALDEVPGLTTLFVDLAREAERSLIRHVSGDNLLIKEGLPRQLETMRKDLAGPNPSPLEGLLVERVVATWLQLRLFETHYAKNLGNLTVAQGEYHQRRLDRLHGRHLSAVKSLSQVRKIGPAVQINIADKQINTAG
jgi:hypothetical protein